MASSPFLTFDANGEFVLVSDATSSPSSPQPRSEQPKPPTVFTFPVRRQSHAALGTSPPSQPCLGDASTSPNAVAAVCQRRKAAEGVCSVETSPASQTADLIATISLHDGGKPGAPLKDPIFARTSLDADARERDQRPAAGSAPQPLASITSTSSPTSLQSTAAAYMQHRSSLQTRSSGGRSSGGGAHPPGPHGDGHHHPHHPGWHNSCEWWRSFSSSRLNQLAAEEPNPRSPEMRHVPYVGGAAPMCALVHGAQEPQ